MNRQYQFNSGISKMQIHKNLRNNTVFQSLEKKIALLVWEGCLDCIHGVQSLYMQKVFKTDQIVLFINIDVLILIGFSAHWNVFFPCIFHGFHLPRFMKIVLKYTG